MLSEFLKDYLPIIIFLIIALGLSCAFVVVNLILSPKHPDPEKLSAYECGFEPFEESHRPFSVAFYLIGLLFVLFDVELIIIMPWCIMAEYGCLWSSWAILVVFFEFLLLGFVFEWSRGAINVILR